MNRRKRVRVRVPATSANLGPGFDCLGLTLDLWNEAEFNLTGETLRLTCVGEGQQLPVDDRNLIVQAIHFFCDVRGLPVPRGLNIHCNNHIPVGSGMGSSAAAALIGILGAAALLDDQPLSQDEAINLAARLEGHADNAAPAMLGGLSIVASGKKGWLIRRVDIPVLQVVVVLPNVNLSTQAARAALPLEVSMKDATFNLGHALLVVEALRNGNLSLLREAMDDRLHLPYRLPLIPGSQKAMFQAYQAGAEAVTISGAGPSLIAFTDRDPEPVARAMSAAFQEQSVPSRAFLLKTSPTGAMVEVAEPVND